MVECRKEEGWIKWRADGEEICKPFIIRKMEAGEIDEIMALEALVVADLESDETFAPDAREDILYDMSHGGVVFGVFVDGNLVAYRYIVFPDRSPVNLGMDIGLFGEELDQVVNFTTTVVHPLYRGNRLQRKTMKHALEYLRGKPYKHLVCTISPLNYYSLKNMIRSGFVIRRIKRKYGKIADEIDGKMRFILSRDIDDVIIRKYRKTITVNNTEIDLQKNLIKNGYVGYDLDELDDDGEYKIFFGVPKAAGNRERA